MTEDKDCSRRFDRRSEMLMAHARWHKLRRNNVGRASIGQKRVIKAFNAMKTRRSEQVTGAFQETLVKGQGAWKKWSEEAVLRSCFQQSCFDFGNLAKYQRRKGLPAKASRARMACSSRTVAEFENGTHGHMRSIRCAVAEVVSIKLQHAACKLTLVGLYTV